MKRSYLILIIIVAGLVCINPVYAIVPALAGIAAYIPVITAACVSAAKALGVMLATALLYQTVDHYNHPDHVANSYSTRSAQIFEQTPSIPYPFPVPASELICKPSSNLQCAPSLYPILLNAVLNQRAIQEQADKESASYIPSSQALAPEHIQSIPYPLQHHTSSQGSTYYQIQVPYIPDEQRSTIPLVATSAKALVAMYIIYKDILQPYFTAQKLGSRKNPLFATLCKAAGCIDQDLYENLKSQGYTHYYSIPLKKYCVQNLLTFREDLEYLPDYTHLDFPFMLAPHYAHDQGIQNWFTNYKQQHEVIKKAKALHKQVIVRRDEFLQILQKIISPTSIIDQIFGRLSLATFSIHPSLAPVFEKGLQKCLPLWFDHQGTLFNIQVLPQKSFEKIFKKFLYYLPPDDKELHKLSLEDLNAIAQNHGIPFHAQGCIIHNNPGNIHLQKLIRAFKDEDSYTHIAQIYESYQPAHPLAHLLDVHIVNTRFTKLAQIPAFKSLIQSELPSLQTACNFTQQQELLLAYEDIQRIENLCAQAQAQDFMYEDDKEAYDDEYEYDDSDNELKDLIHLQSKETKKSKSTKKNNNSKPPTDPEKDPEDRNKIKIPDKLLEKLRKIYKDFPETLKLGEVTDTITRKIAKALGFKETKNYIFNSMRRLVFEKGNIQISLDRTFHNGGFWKVINKITQRRLYTMNIDLTQLIGT